jgi:hypothetical protein
MLPFNDILALLPSASSFQGARTPANPVVCHYLAPAPYCSISEAGLASTKTGGRVPPSCAIGSANGTEDS